MVINTKHFSVFGLHASMTRIKRDITSKYHVRHRTLTKKLQKLKTNCLICQFNATGEKDHSLRKTDYVLAPRVTWAIDLMPNMPQTERGNKAALLAVDLFSGYIQVCPLKDKKVETLISAIGPRPNQFSIQIRTGMGYIISALGPRPNPYIMQA